MTTDDTLLRSHFFRQVTRDLPLRITPGPFEVTPTVLEAAARAFAGHRTPAFKRLLRESREMLLQALEIPESAGYRPVILTGTGTAAMEAMVAATVPGRRPLALVNGRFGRRLADMARLYDPDSVVLDFGVGAPIDPARVEAAMVEHGTDQLLFCVQDTREGILNPFRELCALGREHRHLLTLDAISATVAEEIRPAENGIDLFTASSGKMIRSLPGLGIVCGKKHLLESLDPEASRSYYLDLAEHYRAQEHRGEPRFAPATALFHALHQALVELLEEGVVHRRATIRRRSAEVRRSMAEGGLELLRPPPQMPCSVTSVLLPSGVSFAVFQEELQSRGFLVYSGSSVIEECFQVGTGGHLSDEALAEGLEAIHRTIEQLTIPHKEVPRAIHA